MPNETPISEATTYSQLLAEPICVGVSISVVVPSPSCPKSLFPQAYNSPFLMPRAYVCPADI